MTGMSLATALETVITAPGVTIDETLKAYVARACETVASTCRHSTDPATAARVAIIHDPSSSYAERLSAAVDLIEAPYGAELEVAR